MKPIKSLSTEDKVTTLHARYRELLRLRAYVLQQEAKFIGKKNPVRNVRLLDSENEHGRSAADAG